VLTLSCINWLCGNQLDYPDTTTEDQLDRLAAFAADQTDWAKGLRVWNVLFKFPGGEEQLLARPPESGESLVGLPSFRCTCYR
jgi:hypothetical protein